MSVGFIGAGQLAHALVKGFTAAGKGLCSHFCFFFIYLTILSPGILQIQILQGCFLYVIIMVILINLSDCGTMFLVLEMLNIYVAHWRNSSITEAK